MQSYECLLGQRSPFSNKTVHFLSFQNRIPHPVTHCNSRFTFRRESSSAIVSAWTIWNCRIRIPVTQTLSHNQQQRRRPQQDKMAHNDRNWTIKYSSGVVALLFAFLLSTTISSVQSEGRSQLHHNIFLYIIFTTIFSAEWQSARPSIYPETGITPVFLLHILWFVQHKYIFNSLVLCNGLVLFLHRRLFLCSVSTYVTYRTAADYDRLGAVLGFRFESTEESFAIFYSKQEEN